jgi:hypothetical protein
MKKRNTFLTLALALTSLHCSPQIGGEDPTPGNPPGLGVDAATVPGDLFPNGLQCPTVSMCSTFEADPSRVPFPEGEISDGPLLEGMYRPVQGTSLAYLLTFSNGKWSRAMPNLTVQHGDYTITGPNQYSTVRHTTCANGAINEDAFILEEDYFFQLEGNELLVFGGCGSADLSQCNSPVRLIKVNSPCDNMDVQVCEDGDCKCVDFRDEIPARPDNDKCEFESPETN